MFTTSSFTSASASQAFSLLCGSPTSHPSQCGTLCAALPPCFTKCSGPFLHLAWAGLRVLLPGVALLCLWSDALSPIMPCVTAPVLLQQKVTLLSTDHFLRWFKQSTQRWIKNTEHPSLLCLRNSQKVLWCCSKWLLQLSWLISQSSLPAQQIQPLHLQICIRGFGLWSG